MHMLLELRKWKEQQSVSTISINNQYHFNHIIHLRDIYTRKKLMRLEMPSVCWRGIRCQNKQLRMHWRYRSQSLSSRELGREGQWLTGQSIAASTLLPQSDTHGFSSHALVQPSYPSGQRSKPKRERISSLARVTWSAAFRARIKYGEHQLYFYQSGDFSWRGLDRCFLVTP